MASDDSIMKLAEMPAQKTQEAPATGGVGASVKEAGETLTDTARKAAEIASLEKQIQDKQKKIVLSMRLFVSDEQQFRPEILEIAEWTQS